MTVACFSNGLNNVETTDPPTDSMGPNPNGHRSVSCDQAIRQVFFGVHSFSGSDRQRCLGNQPAYNLRLGSYEVQILDQKTPKSWNLHPGRLTWNLLINHLERKMIFQTSMIMFHVNLPGCSW